jgi:hypothetical protein
MPVEKRLRDTTAGSIRLAIALLRPHFHKHISDDFTLATTHVFNLSCVIAQWPGQWWSREHPEIRELIRCIVHMIGEEMREAKRTQALADATRLEKIVGSLQQYVQNYEAQNRSRKLVAHLPLSLAPSPSPTLPPSPSPSDHKFRLGPVDIITDDTMDEDVIDEPEVIKAPEVSKEVKSAAANIVIEELKYPAFTIPSPSPFATSESRRFELVMRTTSCFLTGLLVGSFIALCVLAPDRRQLAHHLT